MHLLLLLVLLLGCGGASPDGEDAGIDEPLSPPVRMTMAALHASGGVPDGWRLEPPKGSAERGREAFERYGCHSCHVVQGESFFGGATDERAGPELTGMGRHHPPGYFVESILSPSAVITGEPGAAESERSTMPSYPDMPLRDLTDLVAYLSSLKEGGTHDHAAMMAAARDLLAVRANKPRPAPPRADVRAFFVMRYDVLPGRLEEFERWFAARGRPELLAFDGLLTIDSYVHEGERTTVTTVFGFRDQSAVAAFVDDPHAEAIGLEFDRFIGPHGHEVFVRPPLYRAPSLSAD